MRVIPAPEWPAIKLQIHPAVEILRNEWRMTEILCAVEGGREWNQPAHRRTMVLVWRQDAQVNYRDLEDVETGAFTLLSEGASFATCEAVAGLATESNQVPLIGRLLARWLGDGIIVRAEAALTTLPIELDEPLYALTYLWLLISGPGWVSVDYLISRVFRLDVQTADVSSVSSKESAILKHDAVTVP
jgi:hypothetical protein